MVARGDVWWVRLNPTVGHEIQKTRPCLIVSPDVMNRSGVSIIVPLTGGGPHRRFRVPTSVAKKPGAAAVDQVRVIDHARLGRRIGEAEQKVLQAVLATLREMFED